jgi:hypothetical protein
MAPPAPVFAVDRGQAFAEEWLDPLGGSAFVKEVVVLLEYVLDVVRVAE